MKLGLAFSPCPNDTFIFDALVNKKIDTGDIIFEVRLEDVETLNELALAGTMDISKISYGVLPQLLESYQLLDSGSALGTGVGPLLIRSPLDREGSIENQQVAIPGEHTTAHLLFSLAYPAARNKIFLRYDAIEEYVASGLGPGVIIHENRFTYAAKGLEKIRDLGEYWEAVTGVPIPLGGIVMRKNFPLDLQQKITALIRESIGYSFSNYPALAPYVIEYAQEMSEDVMRKHIDLYVNDYSFSLGKEGRQAVAKLLSVYRQMHGLSEPPGILQIA